MTVSLLRQAICLLLCLFLFVACNQGRHIISDKTAKEDREYMLARNNKISKIYSAAHALLGKPYRLGSAGPRSFDCSGFTSKVFQSINLSLPRMSGDQAHLGSAVKLAFAQPGDLLFFGNSSIDHVAIVSKVNSKKIFIIHATSGNGVMEQVLQDSEYWFKRYKGARRVII